jgi:hypothetical protein
VKNAYLDLGYDDTNASTLADFTERELQRKQGAKSNVWSLSAIASAYLIGSIDRGFAFAKARMLLPDDDSANRYINDVDAKRSANSRATCIKSVKKRYMLGELDRLEVYDEVNSYVGDSSAANEIVNGWECEKSSRRKEVAAATLCKWMYQGILSQDQYFTRLLNLGYTTDDATRMLASCGQDVVEKLKAKALKEAKDSLANVKAKVDQALAKLKDTQKKYNDLCAKLQQLDPSFAC